MNGGNTEGKQAAKERLFKEKQPGRRLAETGITRRHDFGCDTQFQKGNPTIVMGGG